MQTRPLGDLFVGEIGLGAMPMSVRRHNDPDLAMATIHAALDAGATLIDTADVYTPDDAPLGHNEELVAQALAARGNPEEVVVATKGGMTRSGPDWGTDGRPEWIREACEGSLRRLGVDAIDLYQHHRPDPEVDYAETIGAFQGLLEAGKVRRVGLSNANADQIRLAHEILGDGLVSVQNQFSPRFTSSLDELRVCEERGLAFLPWSPLGGMSRAGDLGADYATFGEVAARYTVSPQQIALAWQLALSPAVIPIPGASRPESALDSLAAASLRLDDDDVAALSRSVGL